MRYYLNFQQLAKDAVRPTDDGSTIEIDIQADGHALLPNVGDFVHMDNSMTDPKLASVEGKVKSRLFTYVGGTKKVEAACAINIVVEETDDDWAEVIKE